MSAMANDVVLMTYERNRSASGGYSIDVPYGWPVVMSYGGLFVCLFAPLANSRFFLQRHVRRLGYAKRYKKPVEHGLHYLTIQNWLFTGVGQRSVREGHGASREFQVRTGLHLTRIQVLGRG